jgi:hypothetical protein
VELPAGRFVELAGLSPRPITVARRGAEHVAFKSLFVRGFGPDTVLEYRERPPEMSQAFDPPTDWTWARRSIGMLGLIAGALGGTMTGLAVKEKDSVTPSTHGVRRHEVNDRIDVYNGVALASYSVAAVGLTTYLVWTLWPEREVDIQVLPGATPRVQLVVDFWQWAAYRTSIANECGGRPRCLSPWPRVCPTLSSKVRPARAPKATSAVKSGRTAWLPRNHALHPIPRRVAKAAPMTLIVRQVSCVTRGLTTNHLLRVRRRASVTARPACRAHNPRSASSRSGMDRP